MSKLLKYDKDAQASLLAGIEPLYNAVSPTLGPLGSNVAVFKYGIPNILDDGVKVAAEIELEDPFENIGAQLVKDASSKTNDTAGDGTTTSTILAYHIVKNGINKGNPKRLRKQIMKESENLAAALAKYSIPVKDVTQIATISAQDKEVGGMIGEAFKKVGKNGLVTVETGQGTKTELIFKEGMQLERGYESVYFSTNKDKETAEVIEPYILITDAKITNPKEIFPFLETFVKEHKDLVIIAEEVSGEALAALVLNKLHGTINVLAVRAPGFGDRQKDMLQDIAILTGATVISESTGRKIETATIEDCGRADKVWADKDTTRVIGGKGDEDALKTRIKQIEGGLQKSTSDFDTEVYQSRLAKLSGGVAVISVGARTDIELKEKRDHVDDAVAACKSALEEGIIPGGATMLYYLCKGKFLKSVAGKPFEVLMKNSELPNTIDDLKEIGYGIDVHDGKYKDLLKAGIVDPTKVVREALQNAVSIATSILTTKVLIVDKKEEKNASTPII